MDSYSGNNNKVDILITAPSDNEIEGNTYSDEDEGEENGYIYNDNGDNYSDTLSETTDTNSKDRVDDLTDEEKGNETNEEKFCEDFARNTSVISEQDGEEKPPHSEEKAGEGSALQNEEQAQNYEIVGDRVLVEKDGKFELVDANEIKAEYFEMLGIKPEESGGDVKTTKEPTATSSEVKVRERPKTTPARGNRYGEAPPPQRFKRVQSSWGGRRRNDEFGNIRSAYGLTDKQLEIKRKREEAIARRKKEEEEMAREEERRKREDAERAFQVSSHQTVGAQGRGTTPTS